MGMALLAITLLLLTGRAAAEPSASDIEEAKRHYARGVQLYNQGAEAAALGELERAYALAPNYKVLYNLGLVELQLNDFASALRSFERFLAEGGAAVGDARRAEVEKRLTKLREQVATIAITAPQEADVTLDDVVVGKAPLAAPIVVNPGRHKVGATKAGRAAESRVVSVAGGDRASVDVVIEEAPARGEAEDAGTKETPPGAQAEPLPPLAVVLPPPREATPRPPPARGLWIGWVATSVIGAGALATGVAALTTNEALTRAKNDGPRSGADLDHLASRAHTFAIASDLLAGAAILTAGVTLYFTLHRAPSAQVGIGITPTGATLRSTF